MVTNVMQKICECLFADGLKNSEEFLDIYTYNWKELSEFI